MLFGNCPVLRPHSLSYWSLTTLISVFACSNSITNVDLAVEFVSKIGASVGTEEKSSSRPTALQIGESATGQVSGDAYEYYTVTVDEPSSFWIKLTSPPPAQAPALSAAPNRSMPPGAPQLQRSNSYGTGDPDLYVSSRFPRPTKELFEWSSTNRGIASPLHSTIGSGI